MGVCVCVCAVLCVCGWMGVCVWVCTCGLVGWWVDGRVGVYVCVCVWLVGWAGVCVERLEGWWVGRWVGVCEWVGGRMIESVCVCDLRLVLCTPNTRSAQRGPIEPPINPTRAHAHTRTHSRNHTHTVVRPRASTNRLTQAEPQRIVGQSPLSTLTALGFK